VAEALPEHSDRSLTAALEGRREELVT